MMKLLRRIGCVYIVEYDHRYFDTDVVIRAVYDTVLTGNHRKLLVIGASLGGKLALQLIEYDVVHGGGHFVGKTSVIACDAPLGREHLPQPGVQYTPSLHVGSIMNGLFSWPVTHVMFRPMKGDRLSPETDMAHLKRHIKAMRSFKFSAIIEQIAAVVKEVQFPNASRVPTVYLQCDNETVINGDLAFEAWQALGVDLRGHLRVKGEHTSFVEHKDAWNMGLVLAMYLLGFGD